MPPTRVPNSPAGWLTWDRAGIVASGLCLVHCAATPLIVMLASAADSLLGANAWVHPLMLLLVVPLACIALVRGYRRHGHAWVVILGGAGVAAIAAGALAPELLLGRTAEALVTMGGSLLVIAAHSWNLRRLACCDDHAGR